MFEFFTKMIEEFGGLGLILIMLGGLLYFLILKSGKKTEKSIADMSENITSTLVNQNNNMLNVLTQNNTQLQTNMMSLIEKSIMNRDISVKDLHSASMQHRLDISDKMQMMLYEMMHFYHARRCGVMEFHNNTNNLNGLSFLWYDLSYENLQRNVTPISGNCKNQQLSILTPVMNDVIDNNGIAVYRSSDIEKIEERSPVLYNHLVSRIKVNSIIYVGLYDMNNVLIGLAFLEYSEKYPYPESIIDLNDIKQRASGISQLLDFKALVKEN